MNNTNNIKLPHGQKTISNYELILTENCNFRCKYCFDNAFSDRTTCHYNTVMKIDMIPDIIRFIDETRDEHVPTDIVFFGGEPLLNFDFIKAFIKEMDKKEYEVRYSMNTNTSLLTKNIIDFLAEHNVCISVSIDGDKLGNNSTRVTKDGKGTWDIIMAKLPYLFAKYPDRDSIVAMMVVDNHNYNRIVENYSFLINIFDSVNILWDYEAQYTDEQYEEISKQLKFLFVENNYPYYIELRNKLLNSRYHKCNYYCVTPETTVTINPAGKLFLCHRLVPKMSDEYQYTNECFGSIYEGYTNEKFFDYICNRINITNYIATKDPHALECQKCEAQCICHGGCLGSIRGNTDGYTKLPSLCKLMHVIYNSIIKDQINICTMKSSKENVQ